MFKLFWIAVLLGALASYNAFLGDKFDPGTIKNKRVLVTGASSGIGEQVAYYYSQLGAKLVLTARREDLLKNISRTCLQLGARQVHVVAADMAKPDDRTMVINMTKMHLGGLDHLILNHAILHQWWWFGTPEDYVLIEQMMAVNFFSYVDLATKSLEMLTESKGNIGIVSSALSEMSSIKSSFYSTAKFALNGFFSSLRQELLANKTGVSVTIVILGPVASETFMKIHESNPTKISSYLFMSTEFAAKSIVESVSNRQYKVRHGSAKYLLLVKDLFPKFAEDSFSNLLLDDNFTSFIGVPLFHIAFFLSKFY